MFLVLNTYLVFLVLPKIPMASKTSMWNGMWDPGPSRLINPH